jgi:hypothetical protein
VQPVLDRNCVECHATHPDKPMNLGREPIQRNWYASYANLTPKYGFYAYGDGHRTTPGRFGARAGFARALCRRSRPGPEASPLFGHQTTRVEQTAGRKHGPVVLSG